MTAKKKIAALALMCIILLAAISGVLWYITHYRIVDYRAYPKNAQILDLRDQEISIAHYQKLHRAMPDCAIQWNVPIQGSQYPNDTQTLTLNTLTSGDVQALECFPLLQALNVQNCSDYPLLQEVSQRYPQLDLHYTVTIGGRTYPHNAQILEINGISSEELALVKYLPEVKLVRLESGKDAVQLMKLADYCQRTGIELQLILGGQSYDANASELTVSGITDEDIQLLSLLPQIKSLTLIEPKASPDSLIALTFAYPDASIRWEKSVLGTSYPHDIRELDLTEALSPSGAKAIAQAKNAPIMGTRDEIAYQFAVNSKYPLPDMTADTQQLIVQLEQDLAYFPDLQQVILCGSILDNEAMAAFRETHRQDYKVVWTVQLGDKLIARTDTPYLMPTKYHVYYFLDDDAVNLKYCEDLICIDLGHMAIRNIDWITSMPKLTYLVLAHTQLMYIEPLRTCKNLKFLELDWSPIRDFSPLTGCTALEDLNIGNTYADVTPIGQMTWLKNLWMIGCSTGYGYRMTQALPNTTVMLSGNATVASGWRTLPNYYAMRDALNMFDMVW